MKKLLTLMILCVFLLNAVGCSSNQDKIVIYTCQEEERIQALKKAVKDKYPELNVVIEQMGTGNLAAKIKSEESSIEADIVLDLESSHMENLKDSFYSLDEFDTSSFIDGINPSHKKYVVWVKNHAAITVNKDYFETNNLDYPKTYEDLLDSKYEGLIAMPDPCTSGTGYAYYLNVVNIMGADKALDYFEKLTNNIKQYTSSGSGPISLLQQGEIAIAMGMEFQGVAQINNGANYKLIELETGAPYNLTGAAIIEGKQDKANVKELFQWLISDFHYIDCEEYVPGKVLKNQVTKVNNYIDMLDANMTNIDSMAKKEELISKWDLS